MTVGFIGGDIERLHAAGAALKPDVERARAHARAASACGRQAAEAAACPQVSAAAESLARVLATTITATGVATGQLDSTADTESDGLEETALA